MQVLVAWEHVNIQYLVRDLGVAKEKIPTWSDSDYDTVYALQASAATVAAGNFLLSAFYLLLATCYLLLAT